MGGFEVSAVRLLHLEWGVHVELAVDAPVDAAVLGMQSGRLRNEQVVLQLGGGRRPVHSGAIGGRSPSGRRTLSTR